jgi:hypothetical protein
MEVIDPFVIGEFRKEVIKEDFARAGKLNHNQRKPQLSETMSDS